MIVAIMDNCCCGHVLCIGDSNMALFRRLVVGLCTLNCAILTETSSTMIEMEEVPLCVFVPEYVKVCGWM